jgi:hypothetical protein
MGAFIGDHVLFVERINELLCVARLRK